MATVHREPNRVKWIGVRPGHNGSEVLINIDVAVNTLLYTVGADKLLLIYDWQLGVIQSGATVAHLQLRTAVPAAYYELASLLTTAGWTTGFASQSLQIPIEVPATYQVYLTTNLAVKGGVHGILIDV